MGFSKIIRKEPYTTITLNPRFSRSLGTKESILELCSSRDPIPFEHSGIFHRAVFSSNLLVAVIQKQTYLSTTKIRTRQITYLNKRRKLD